MVKNIYFRIKKIFLQVSTMSRSNLFRYFCKEKNIFFQLGARDATVKLFEMFIIYCSVAVRTEKIISSDLLGIIR